MKVTVESSEVTAEKTAEAVRRIAAYARPSRILVFGSAARGEQRKGSDLDVLVVMAEAVDNWRKAATAMEAQLFDIAMPVDILVISEAEAAAAVGNRYGVLGPALREGKLVYEASK